MIAGLTDIEHGIEVGSLSGGRQHTPYAAFEGVDLGSHSIVGGICQTGVEIALFFQVEETRHLFAGVILERGALIDRQLLGLAFRRFPTAMDTEGFEILFHT